MRLIDADEIIYESDIFDCYPDRCDRFCSQCNKGIARRRRIVNMPTVDAILIQDGATNGDALKAVFPSIESRLDERTGIMLIKWVDGTTKTFKASWWNAPYKGESEVER